MNKILIILIICAICCCCCSMMGFFGVQGAQNNAISANLNLLALPQVLGICPNDPIRWTKQKFTDDTYCMNPAAIGIADNTGKLIGARLTSICPYVTQTINNTSMCVNG